MTNYKFTIEKRNKEKTQSLLVLEAENLKDAVGQALKEYPLHEYKLISCIRNYVKGRGGLLVENKLLRDTIKSCVNNDYGSIARTTGDIQNDGRLHCDA